jgi:anti-anti-sigma factor
MTLYIRETADEIIVFFTDAKIVDEAQIQEVGGGLLDICKQATSTAKRLLVDFRGIQFMSSAMIGKLVLLSKAAKQRSLDLRFANISPNVLEVFKITRLHTVFRLDDDNPDLLGAGVPKPKPPGTLDAGAKPPSE